MTEEQDHSPLEDSVPKVDNAVAVGENLAFQRKWWTFERVLWSFFTLVLLADVSGLLGRGPLSKAQRINTDRTLDVRYERIERANTPSILTVLPTQGTVHEGKLQLYVSDSLVRELGNQRVIPQPLSSVIGEGGITYTFAASVLPMTLQFALEPSFPGVHTFLMRVPGSSPVQAKIAVLP